MNNVFIKGSVYGQPVGDNPTNDIYEKALKEANEETQRYLNTFIGVPVSK